MTRKQQTWHWPQQHYPSFKRLCIEALRLDERPARGGLMEASPPVYPDVGAARKALHADPMYRWMKQHVSGALASLPPDDPFAEFRIVQLLVKFIALDGVSVHEPNLETRPDKQRDKAVRDIKRVAGHLEDGTLNLPNPARHEMLKELLAEAREILAAPHPLPPTWLQALAVELYEQFRTADPKLLLDLAAALGLEPMTTWRSGM